MDNYRQKSQRNDRRSSSRRDGDNGPGGRRSSSSSSGPNMRSTRALMIKGQEINYKNLGLLQKCLTERGKLVSRRLTSYTAKQQRLLGVAIKRARFLGLLPSGSSKHRKG